MAGTDAMTTLFLFDLVAVCVRGCVGQLQLNITLADAFVSVSHAPTLNTYLFTANQLVTNALLMTSTAHCGGGGDGTHRGCRGERSLWWW